MLWNKNWLFYAATIIFLLAELSQLVKSEYENNAQEISWLVELEPFDVHRYTGRFRLKREAVRNNENEKQPKITSFRIHSNIKFRYSRTLVTSKVENPEENLKSQEVLFSVVVPETAFISQFSIEVNGKQYRAKVLQKQEASLRYEQAKRGHRTAGLVELNPRFSNVFTVNVNVEPQGSIIFRLAYEELLRRRLGLYEQLINIIPGQLAATPIPYNQISVHIEDTSNLVDVGADINCNNVKMENDDMDIIVLKSTTRAWISWSVSTDDKRVFETGMSCQLGVHFDVERKYSDKAGEILISQGYFVHFFALDDLSPIPQHLVFILDISGSMAGEKMEQMKKAQIQILSEMRETDYFSIIIFDDKIQLWTPQPVAATRTHLEKARSYIRMLNDGGATNIHGALMEGLRRANTDTTKCPDDLDKPKGDDDDVEGSGDNIDNVDDVDSEDEPLCSEKMLSNVKPLIIFLTDGKPNRGITNLDEILTSIRAANRDINVPILSLGFGSDVDFPFLKKLSLQNHGFARKIYEGADASLQIRNFYREVSSLLLTDIKFRYTSIGASDILDLTETKFSEYFRGTDIVVAGKLDTTDFCGSADASLKNLEKLFKANLTGCGAEDGAMKWLDIPANLIGPADCGQPNPWNAELATPDDKFLEALWAYLTIRQLLDNEATGIAPSAMGNQKALELSLKYGFVTPLTSLLVVTPQQQSQIVPVVNDDDARVSRRFPQRNAAIGISGYAHRGYHHTSFSSAKTTNSERHFTIFISLFSVLLSQY